MNLDNICEGLIIKNYKEACEVLGEPVKGGKSKTLQMQDWKRYFDYEKQGHKIIILKIHDMIIDKLDSKTSSILSNINSGKFSKDVFPMVKNFVGNHDVEYISKSKLLKELGFINDNYTYAYLNPKEFTRNINKKYNQSISEEFVNSIVNSIYSIAHNKIHNAFNNLEKLNYIYSYDNKMLMLYNRETYQVEMPTNYECETLNSCIYQGKAKALSNFFSRSSQPVESFISLISKIKEDSNNDMNIINKKLNQELFLRGLSKEAHDISLKHIVALPQFKYVKNFFYVYGYIKNEDIEWDKEIIDIAKENIHLNNYKEQVKNMFVLDTFLDKWFDEKHEECKSVVKYEFKSKLETHRKSMKDIVNILFDTLTNVDTKVNLENIKESEMSELPF